ncbi:scaffold protein CheW associated with MCPs of class 44H [Syntrophotalea carbinolica DSM 2380]|uniref:Scaffold protein CheW associated with MCPs of class 44H n=1 Tax=Syntrophotalea carbinolica (strain DSM 2380 / NBRC 103641 / GraBd1) TaxID=338963 RepID=Q3A8J9_SYNC1|nr:chemotaxis protein CheW [Syntrophotalea carbinolica]ABA87293.1 scaffold protein CheW associated with MCPs of class 44H [Syntrophotalea carbinolica DSM 2380]
MARTLLLASGRSLFGLDIRDVREVLKGEPVHQVPLAPAGLLGAINVHDTVVPVIDFGRLLGRDHAPVDQVVVLESHPLALAVTAVHGLCTPVLCLPGGIVHPWVHEVFISSRGIAGLIDAVVLQQTLQRWLTPAGCMTSASRPDRI